MASFDFGDGPSNYNDAASVQCLVTSGDLPISFKWFFNQMPVTYVSGISTVKLGNKISALSIDSVTEKHAGNYTCQASNSASIVNYTAELVVKGRYKLHENNIFTFLS